MKTFPPPNPKPTTMNPKPYACTTLVYFCFVHIPVYRGLRTPTGLGFNGPQGIASGRCIDGISRQPEALCHSLLEGSWVVSNHKCRPKEVSVSSKDSHVRQRQ